MIETTMACPFLKKWMAEIKNIYFVLGSESLKTPSWGVS